jgi:hypothetical protein
MNQSAPDLRATLVRNNSTIPGQNTLLINLSAFIKDNLFFNDYLRAVTAELY